MKNKLYLLVGLTSLMFCSCASFKPLQGNYSNDYTITTTTSYDEVWDNVVDFFACTGVSISTIEKASGIIVSKDVTVSQTREKSGRPFESSAFVVVPNAKSYATQTTATFTVRVRDYGNYVKIAVYMHNIKPTVINNKWLVVGESTGVFETKLLDLFR